jgi:uncharacterized protein (TIGR02594 family)
MFNWFKKLIPTPELDKAEMKDFKDPLPPTKDLNIPAEIRMAGVYSSVPGRWSWLLGLQGLPKMVSEGLKEYGTLEGAGTLNNKKIIGWADEVARLHPTTYTNWAADWYNKDSVPWCGLYAAIIACRSANGAANRMPPPSYLSSLAWAAFGKTVDIREKNNIWMGDIAVFTREGGGHVGIVIGLSKDGQYIVLLGGNQGDKVDIKMIAASRLYAVRRPPYNVRPVSARHFRIESSGVPVSTNEG